MNNLACMTIGTLKSLNSETKFEKLKVNGGSKNKKRQYGKITGHLTRLSFIDTGIMSCYIKSWHENDFWKMAKQDRF